MSEQSLVNCGVEYRLCLFEKSDIADIAALEAEASSHPWPRSHFASSLASGDFCVGLKHNRFWVAHAVFSAAHKDLELLIIAVRPGYQRRSLASTLIRAVIDGLGEQFEGVLLEVRRSNNAAISCYQKLGFKQVGMRKGYYRQRNGRSSQLGVVAQMTPSQALLNKRAEDALLFRFAIT